MLTPEQLNYFRPRLQQQREALRADAAEAERQIAAPDAIADAISDQGDDANMLFAREETMNELARVQQTLAQVEHALQRLEAGSYGYSEVSGRPIPIERLEALPYATTLVGELSQE